MSTVDDRADESPSTVTATVNSGTGYAVGSPSSAMVTVNDNDDAPPRGQPVVTIEADADQVTGGTEVEFTVTATPAPAVSLVVNVEWSDPDNRLEAPPPETVTISAGDTTATLSATTASGGASGTVTVTVGSGAGYTVGSPSSAAVTVTADVPDQPTVTISAVASSVIEGEAVRFTVRANPPPTADLEVIVSWSDPGGFLDGSQPTTLTITTTGTATLTAGTEDDAVDGNSSTVMATLSLPDGSGYTLSPASASVTVRDNDGDPEVTISRAGAPSVPEGTAVQFTVTATPAPQAILVVNVGWSESGSMLAASRPATVTIPTTGSATLTADTVDDNTDESNSTVTATVNSGTGYTVSPPGSATVTVIEPSSSVSSFPLTKPSIS